MLVDFCDNTMRVWKDVSHKDINEATFAIYMDISRCSTMLYARQYYAASQHLKCQHACKFDHVDQLHCQQFGGLSSH